MIEIPLADFTASHTQQGAANVLGWTQGAVWQALRAGREIYIVEHDDGTASAYEVRHLAGRKLRTRPVGVESDEAA